VTVFLRLKLLITSLYCINELIRFQCEVKRTSYLCLVNAFSALLTDLIRTPDFSWKEAKKILKKDSRYNIGVQFWLFRTCMAAL
jgi:hypothetical protein